MTPCYPFAISTLLTLKYNLNFSLSHCCKILIISGVPSGYVELRKFDMKTIAIFIEERFVSYNIEMLNSSVNGI